MYFYLNYFLVKFLLAAFSPSIFRSFFVSFFRVFPYWERIQIFKIQENDKNQ